MAVDFRKEVEYVARLARLTLKEDEKEQMAGQLRDILDIARRIQKVDTSDVDPTSHIITLPAALREDVVSPSLSLNRVLQNAPRREKDLFRVPSITGTEQPDQ